MIKIVATALVLVLCYGTLSSQAGEIVLKINNIKKVKKQSLQINYSLTNNTDNSIWVCNDVDDKSGIDYEISFDEKSKKLKFRIASIAVPQNILLEEPIWAMYVKLPPKNSLKGTISRSVPLTEIKIFKTKKNAEQKLVDFADTVILELGIYKINLEANRSGCCRDDSDGRTMFVNCFWAEKNKEQIVTSQEVNYRVPVTIER